MRRLITLIFFFMSFQSLAQQPIDSLRQFLTKPQIALKFNPVAWFDYTSSLQFAVEYSINSKLNLQNEIGFISNKISFFRYILNTISSMTGVRLRNELRYYSKQNKFDESIYIAFELMNKSWLVEQDIFVLKHNGAYFERQNLQCWKHAAALHLKIGSQYKLLGSENFIIDYYFGLGVRYIYSPDFEIITETDIDFFEIENGFYPSAVAGFKIGYVFR